MGARSYGHRNENKLNTERLLILSACANKGDISDRVVQKKQTELRFHCNQMMNWRWMNKFFSGIEFKLCELNNEYEKLNCFVNH